jgi:hypothetical protein
VASAFEPMMPARSANTGELKSAPPDSSRHHQAELEFGVPRMVFRFGCAATAGQLGCERDLARASALPAVPAFPRSRRKAMIPRGHGVYGIVPVAFTL